MISQSVKSLSDSPLFGVSENLLYTRCKAKYAVTPEGETKLLSIQEFSQPRFKPEGWELPQKSKIASSDDGSDIVLDEAEKDSFSDKLRAVRRAKIACFDYIVCNPELDVFATLTLSPDAVERSSWTEAYKAIRGWLSNRVQRHYLRYILVPEYHKDGKSIHFHSVMNSAALKLNKARYPDSGRLMYHKGQQVYNIADFKGGFTTAKIITGESSADKVAKYIFKYMGKQMGARIGGRYYLHGGDLRVPLCRYADDPAELLLPGSVPTHTKEVEVTQNLRYKEVYFV
ncbi:MAG: hypothetical protein IKL81_05080 [Clostridia bacterium]|nr:hypothetical protein [Clostridia bacterium]